MYINTDDTLDIEVPEFHSHQNLVLSNGNLRLRSLGIHNGRFMCNVTTNSVVELNGPNIFRANSRFFSNTLRVNGEVTFNGVVGIRYCVTVKSYCSFYQRNIVAYGNVTLATQFRTAGSIQLFDGITRFQDNVTINTLLIQGSASVIFSSKVIENINYFLHFC